uniref:Programmed cell death 7 n=1 Tax=Gouania willdenowi TaxID=441366 RepID=A0A8C5GKH6_GOUWI
MNNPFQNSQKDVSVSNSWVRPSQDGFLPWIPPVWSDHPFGFTDPPPIESYNWSSSNTSSRFGCLPPGHFSVGMPSALGSGRFANTQHDRASMIGCNQRPDEDVRENNGAHSRVSTGHEMDLQKQKDIWWVRRLSQSRRKQFCAPLTRLSIQTHKDAVFHAADVFYKLNDISHTLKGNVHIDSGWQDSYLTALHMKRELKERVKCSVQLKAKVSRAGRRMYRRHRAPSEEEMKQRSDREAAIDERRMKQMQQVEELIKEKEIKQAADSVLCEVRKKQADVKRMQDVLRSLEKLRKLRKEAASRKGCDDAFSNGLEQLKSVLKRRTGIYATEEKALMVMLEGEQEEERRREWQRRLKKETWKQLEQKRKVNSMLFGDECPADCVLQLFTQYYTQGQHSLHVLIEIRRKWDMHAVPADHPDGSSVPQSWVLPEAPSHPAWASALQNADTL